MSRVHPHGRPHAPATRQLCCYCYTPAISRPCRPQGRAYTPAREGCVSQNRSRSGEHTADAQGLRASISWGRASDSSCVHDLACVELRSADGRQRERRPADRECREPFPPVCRLTPPLLRVTHPSPRERVGQRVRDGGGAASEGRHAAIPPAMCCSRTRVDRRSGHASVRKARAVEQRSTLVPSGTAIVPHSPCPKAAKPSVLTTSALD